MTDTEQIDELRVELQRVREELKVAVANEACCHCGLLMSRHGYSENHGAVAMVETCPFEKAAVDNHAELSSAQKEIARLTEAEEAAQGKLTAAILGSQMEIERLKEEFMHQKEACLQLGQENASLQSELDATKAASSESIANLLEEGDFLLRCNTSLRAEVEKLRTALGKAREQLMRSHKWIPSHGTFAEDRINESEDAIRMVDAALSQPDPSKQEDAQAE